MRTPIATPVVTLQRRTAAQSIAQLYRTVRAVEADPERTGALLSDLLRDIFEPLEANPAPGGSENGARVSDDGSTLRVSLPAFDPVARSGAGGRHATTIELRFALFGRRAFTTEDADLADRIVEQLQRAVAHDAAVEQGRTEERLRLAQDLHDDIGARLLTLMYKAQSPEMEEYVRHTLQDLKTLTRGLAAPSHLISEASAEWKADLGQRLAAAHLELRWSCHFSDDIVLSVVQWSALTRILRELLSNVIAHADARRVEVDIQLVDGRLQLAVSDDGIGRQPAGWSHGLGLGGVRKRVKQLDGEVHWRELAPRGIACEVRVNGVGRAT
ncbi:MAG: ATP-binding protein [Burkholderiaceae bacterium]